MYCVQSLSLPLQSFFLFHFTFLLQWANTFSSVSRAWREKNEKKNFSNLLQFLFCSAWSTAISCLVDYQLMFSIHLLSSWCFFSLIKLEILLRNSLDHFSKLFGFYIFCQVKWFRYFLLLIHIKSHRTVCGQVSDIVTFIFTPQSSRSLQNHEPCRDCLSIFYYFSLSTQ